MNWFKRLKAGLSKSSGKLSQGIDEIVEKGEVKTEIPAPEPIPAPEYVPELPPEPSVPAIKEEKKEALPKHEIKTAAELPPAPKAPLPPEPKPEKKPEPKPEPEKPEPTVQVPKPSAPAPKEKPAPEKKSLVGKLTSVLGKSTAIVTKRKLDEAMLEALEELLISSDMGVNVASEVTAALAKDRFDKEVSAEEVREVLAEKIAAILATSAQPLTLSNASPHVVLVVGVNGNGKTTTLGKLAQQYKSEGKKVMMAACDTFRAAAVEQLSEWGNRVGVEVISGPAQSDPGSVAYKALEEAKKKNIDVLLIDSAGRLQNKEGLMEELAKIIRVMKKLDEHAPHHTVLVLDATTGQNAHSQVQVFKEKVNISGLIVTKLDGTAKGGVVVALAKKFGLPIYAVGVGEGVEDLKPFAAADFARSLMGLGN